MRELAELLRSNMLRSVYHGEHGVRTLKELGRSYLAISKDLGRVMSSIKGVKKKNTSPVAGVFLVQPAPLSRFVLAFRSVSSGRYVVAVALLVFSRSRFHHFFATKPVRSETNKQYGCQVATMVPFGTRGP